MKNGIREEIVNVLRDFDEVRSIRTLADALETVLSKFGVSIDPGGCAPPVIVPLAPPTPSNHASSNAWHTACVNLLWTKGDTYKLFEQIKEFAEAIERGEVYPVPDGTPTPVDHSLEKRPAAFEVLDTENGTYLTRSEQAAINSEYEYNGLYRRCTTPRPLIVRGAEPAIRKAGQIAIDELIDRGITDCASDDELADYLTRIVDACVRAAASEGSTDE